MIDEPEHIQILYLFADPSDPGDAELVQSSNDEQLFLENYYKTYDRHWLSTYQRPPPIIPFVQMDADNARTKWVESTAYFWTCSPSKDQDKDKAKESKISRIIGRGRNSGMYGKCRDSNKGQPLKFMIEMLYPQDPRIYKISNFVNEVEAEHLVDISRKKMHRSTVGDGVNARQDPTRTCSNTWLSMNHSEIVETVYYRIGDVLGIEQYKMSAEYTIQNAKGEVEGVASHMEVVHFGKGEHYSRHFDNAVTDEVFLHFVTFQVILSTSDDFKGLLSLCIRNLLGKKGEFGFVNITDLPPDHKVYRKV